MSEVPPQSLQENILTALCFSDSAIGVIVGLIEPEIFDNSTYRLIAEKAIKYYNRYHKAPRNHIADLLEKELLKDKRQSRDFKRTLEDLYYMSRDGFNEEFIIGSLRTFLRQQRLKTGIVEAARQVQVGSLDDAQDIILKAISEQDKIFDPGINLQDAAAVIKRVEGEEEVFKTGIEELDRLHIGPYRKGLLLLMAPTNRGKTWGLIHFGKHCLLQRQAVLHVTLEMSDTKILKRYMQSLFGFGKGTDKVRVKYMEFKKDPSKRTYVGHKAKFLNRNSLQSSVALKEINRKLYKQRFERRLRLVVKEFPTASLSIRELEAYLDVLDRSYQFRPDVIIVDYADLMKIDISMLREDTGRIYKELRRIAGQRNVAMLTASQSNRLAEDARLVTLKHSAEDYSKVTTSDVVITYTQTLAEKQMGLARLFLAKVRDEKSGMIIVISQNYEIGRFAADSALLFDSALYNSMLSNSGKDEED